MLHERNRLGHGQSELRQRVPGNEFKTDHAAAKNPQTGSAEEHPKTAQPIADPTAATAAAGHATHDGSRLLRTTSPAPDRSANGPGAGQRNGAHANGST